MYLRDFLREIVGGKSFSSVDENVQVSFVILPDFTQLILETFDPITLGSSEIETLAIALGILPNQISIPEWEQIYVASGDTDDFDCHRLTINLPGGQNLLDVEARLERVIEPLRQERKELAEEERREQAIRRAADELRWAELEVEHKRKTLQRKMDSEKESLNHKWGLEAFNTYSEQIFEALVQDFRKYAATNRKSLWDILNEMPNPVRNFIYALHSDGRCAGDPQKAFKRVTMKDSDKAKLGQWWKSRWGLGCICNSATGVVCYYHEWATRGK